MEIDEDDEELDSQSEEFEDAQSVVNHQSRVKKPQGKENPRKNQ